jgi:bacterial/archaeal transporter family-2 protein
MQLLWYVMALVGGVLLTIQVGANSTLRQSLGGALAAALTSFVVGLVGLALLLVLSRQGWPGRDAWLQAPLWSWFGGLMGAYYVATAITVGPRLGAATLLALSVLGQLLTSMLVDNYGWIGFPQHPFTTTRLIGAVLLFGGVLLIAR